MNISGRKGRKESSTLRLHLVELQAVQGNRVQLLCEVSRGCALLRPLTLY